MARRRQSALDLFILLPWWASAIAGIGCWAVLQFAVPLHFASHPYAAAVIPPAERLAPYALAFFAILGFGSWVRAAITARDFDRQNGLEDIRKWSWRKFESIVGEAFRRQGYAVLENANAGPDGGVDLVLRKEGKKFYVQCKQWKQIKVGVKPVREIFGVVTAGDAAGGFFVASGEYTAEAREFAKKTSLVLIDGSELARMVEAVREPNSSVEPKGARQEPTVAAPEPARTPACPSCGEAMILRTAKRGANAGAEFWGCSAYPKCRGTRAV